MIHFYLFLFIFIQACSPIGGLLNLNESDSKTNNYWWLGLLQGNNHPAPIENLASSHEDVAEENGLNENDDALWTLLVGAPNGNTSGSGLAIDTNGFIYVAGHTDVGIYNENPIGTNDLILAKYNSRKQIIWSKQVGVQGTDFHVVDVGVDARGNVYVIATRRINFGNNNLSAFKFDTNGNQIWGRQTNPGRQNNYIVRPKKIFVDSSGTSYIVGTLNPTRDFHGLKADGFLIKIDAQGNWGNTSLISIPGAMIYFEGVTVADNTGDVFVTGTANANLETNTTPGTGNFDLFVLKYDRNGRRQLFAQLGQALSRTEGNSITLDSFGNVFVGGMSNANFEPGGEVVESDRGILVKYDSFGVRQWVRYLGPANGRRTTSFNSIITDSEGNIFTTGTSNHMVDGRQNGIGMDLLLTKHDSLGQEEWIRQIGGIDGASIIGKEIEQDPEGNLYCTGLTDSPSINEAVRQGNGDLFLLKFR